MQPIGSITVTHNNPCDYGVSEDHSVNIPFVNMTECAQECE